MPLPHPGRKALFCLLLLLGTAGVANAAGAAEAACEAPPPGPRDIRAMGYYTDKASSIIDPRLQQENREATRPLDDYAARLAGWTDAYLRSGAPEPAQCALQWMSAWARDGAMLGRMIRVNNDQSFYMRQWMLDAVAMAYLKVNDQADAAQRATIAPWLQQLAVANLTYWDDPRHRRNNHYYWGGLGVLATGLATHDEALWRAGREAFRSGVQAVQPDGSLPFEMARGRRALHYHDYALAPLVMMAELARLRGEDWYGDNHQAIDRLARRVAAGWSDPSWFAERTGVRQELGQPGASSGWVEFYRLRSADPAAFDAMHARAARYRDPRLGGDLALMATRGIVRAL